MRRSWKPETARLGLVAALLLPACAKRGLATTSDAGRDTANVPADLPAADSPPEAVEDLPPGSPDASPTSDRPPSEPAPEPDLHVPSDLPGEGSDRADVSDVSRLDLAERDLAPPDLTSRDLNQQDVTGPLDLPVDPPPRSDLSIDLDTAPAGLDGVPDRPPDLPDTHASLDDRGASDDCTSTGGTVDTQSCCSSVSDFRDTCTTAVGACGCAPTDSHAVSMCVCPSPSCFLPGYGCVGPGSTCTVGMDQTCNDNLLISSIHGRCVADGRCVCGNFGMSTTSGKCL
jgi:hypothetical protein